MLNRIKRKLRSVLRSLRISYLVYKRKLSMLLSKSKYSKTISKKELPVRIYKHKSLIRRKLGDVNMQLQENKAINLKLSAPKVNGILIKPNETFSFWKLVGNCTEKKGYKSGLTINGEKSEQGIGGGMCQFTNLLHWLTIHSPLDIVEHHHHDGIDLFPDFGRVIPFGCETSIYYNFLDYQIKNNTDKTFQFTITLDEKYLVGELRCSDILEHKYHIKEKDSFFTMEGDSYFRNNKIVKEIINKDSGQLIDVSTLKISHALVKYDAKYINKEMIR